MNEFHESSFLSLWDKYKDEGLRYIIGRMHPDNRPKIESWIRKPGHFDMSPNILLEAIPNKNNTYFLCRYLVV